MSGAEAGRDADVAELQSGSGAVPLLLQRARLAAEMHKWATALVLARRCLQLQAQNPEALSLYGLCLARLGQNLEPARAACQRAVDAEPYDARHHAALGRVYASAGLRGRAAECFREALRLDPAQVAARAGLAALVPAPRLGFVSKLFRMLLHSAQAHSRRG